MNVVIIEDESPISDHLTKQLFKIDPDICVQGVLNSVQTSVDWLSNHQPDLIFLDIQLGNELSFKIFEEIQVFTPVIFTTAYSEYALKAFEVNGIDYLIKPIQTEHLEKAIEKYRKLRKFDLPHELPWQKLLELHTKQYQQRFLVTQANYIKSIPIEQVSHFWVENKYTYLVTMHKECYLIDYSLDKLQVLIDPFLFFRINRQYIVHVQSIEQIKQVDQRIRIYSKNLPDQGIWVSIDRVTDFKKWLNR